MSEKTKKFDILGDILNDSHSGAIRGMNELSQLIFASPKDRLLKAAAKAPHDQKQTRATGRKRKTTHYLTEKVFGNLGEAKADIREFLPDASKSKATKSSIIESAINVVLQEFKVKGKDSVLIQELLKKKE
jgi:hypothetical protein